MSEMPGYAIVVDVNREGRHIEAKLPRSGFVQSALSVTIFLLVRLTPPRPASEEWRLKILSSNTTPRSRLTPSRNRGNQPGRSAVTNSNIGADKPFARRRAVLVRRACLAIGPATIHHHA